jgi:hypothetical protein
VHEEEDHAAPILRARTKAQICDSEPYSVQARHWVAERLVEERLSFLAALPLDLTLELDALGDVRFCHGAPGSDKLAITPLTTDERLRALPRVSTRASSSADTRTYGSNAASTASAS